LGYLKGRVLRKDKRGGKKKPNPTRVKLLERGAERADPGKKVCH